MIETLVSSFCSSEFVFEGRINILCKWIRENSSLYYDSYETALNDCPAHYLLDDLVRLKTKNSTSLRLSCSGPLKVWKKLNDNTNLLTIYPDGKIESKNFRDGKNSYFICSKKGYYENCSSNDDCDDFVGLKCFNGKCRCSEIGKSGQ